MLELHAHLARARPAQVPVAHRVAPDDLAAAREVSEQLGRGAAPRRPGAHRLGPSLARVEAALVLGRRAA